MDRQPHDYAAAMSFAQQQQQYGFHPQHQQFPPPGHGPPFLPPHPSLQPYPFHRHLSQQPPQLHPHPHPHPHLLHPQPQTFPPHLPPHLVPSSFPGLYDSPPPPAPPPSDPELQNIIDKLVEYAAKNGPDFEAMIREKQQDNPAYSFLFGGEGHNYYRYKLWLSTRPPGGPGPGPGPFGAPFSSSMPMMHPPLNSMINPSLNAPPLNASAPPQMHQSPFPPYYEQQHSQPFMGHARPDYDPSSKSFKGLSGPLPSDVAMELSTVLNNLTGTKESIKGAKIWFMQRSPFAPALAEALRERVFALDDSERQLHIIYLANDILFDSLQRRSNLHDLDNEALAFKPVLGSMLGRIYHNPQNNEENQSRLQKILQFWASKEVYDPEIIYGLESEMIGRAPTNSFSGPPKELSASLSDPSAIAGLLPPGTHHTIPQWQTENQSSMPSNLDQLDNPSSSILPMPPSHFLPNTAPSGPFIGSLPIPSPAQPTTHLLPTPNSQSGEKLPPYPLFPPGLIPGMVKKMQIGSGVPYSPMSPLDIPTVIPHSNVSPSEILDRVSKFFKEIGEVNPSKGSLRPSDSDDDDDEREAIVRKGGACIPPPPHLRVDPESGTYADGTVEKKPGSSSGSGRLGLGATADPNEVSQYDDVYTSYRKQRSTNYHTSMSARAATR